MLITYYSLLITIFLYSMLYTFFIIGGDFMLNKNRKLSKKGFSLIELMVAVAILALAIFGIFHAYSVGFMGMADARDRTVATNYLQEMIENYKNMNFNQVKSEPITVIPSTKFNRGAYVLNLEEVDGIVTLKKIIAQIRWMDRQGKIKTERASTTIYNKPATSEVGEGATKLVLYAQSYYTILPEHDVFLIAEIKDENGNIFDWDGPITFSVITDPPNSPQVGNITTTQPSPATNGVANCTFTAITGENVEGIERIQALAIIGGEELTDTVNIRVTTGPVGIIIAPATEDDKILPAGETSNINLTVVKADYSTPIEYNSPITLSTDIGSLGILSITTIPSVPTEGITFSFTSNGTPGIVEITASAPDLDMGYTEITFTGPPASILITPEKKSIYPGEDIDVTITLVDENNIPVSFNGDVNLTVSPVYGNFNNDTLSFTGQSSLNTTIFTANPDAPPGEKITLQATNGSITGSVQLTILSLLTPYYLDIEVYPFSVNLDGGENSTTVTAKIYDDSGSKIVTTYNNTINFISMKDGSSFGSFSPSDYEVPVDGEVEVTLSSDDPGTTTITASSGELVLRPEGGREVVFYSSPHHIELSADPLSIEADGHETSIITATVCDADGNRVANYGQGGDKSITFTTDKGGFPDNSDLTTITKGIFDEGQVSVALSSIEIGTATISASSSDGSIINGEISIDLTGDIPSFLTLGDITNWDDYRISFDLTVTGSQLYLTSIDVEWDNIHAVLNYIKIYSPYDESDENSLEINSGGSSSPYKNAGIEDILTIEKKSTIYLHFGNVSNAAAKMKNKNVTVTLTDEDGIEYPPLSFKIP